MTKPNSLVLLRQKISHYIDDSKDVDKIMIWITTYYQKDTKTLVKALKRIKKNAELYSTKGGAVARGGHFIVAGVAQKALGGR